MGAEPELLRALERAVLDDPDNVPLRLHLARLLLDAGRTGAALDHCATVLDAEPGNAEAEALSASAREQLGGAATPTATPAATPVAEAEPVGPVDPVVDDLFEIFRPDVTLDDVGGMDHVKQRVRMSFLDPMRNPEVRAAYGHGLRSSLLLWGPPGCGKTFLARALAGELGVYFMPVGIADILDMWVGQSERNIASLFRVAREMAPTVVFLDELDAVGRRRSQLRAESSARNTVNQLLVELDGVESDNEGVFTLAATNQPWDVDPALVRPGRFDRMVLVLPPDPPARMAILRYHLRNRPVGTLRLEDLVTRTDMYSGADLAAVCERATESAMQDAFRTGTVRPIEQRDLEVALADVRPSTVPWLRSAKNVAMFADDDRYDELLRYLKQRKL